MEENKKCKKVIYTAIAGDYDELMQPPVIDPEYDYVCFVDNPVSGKCGVWEMRKHPFWHKDPVRRAKYSKVNPHKVLGEYDYSLWIDANVTISSPYIYKRVNQLISSGCRFAYIRHWGRDCIYEEGIECIALATDSIVKIVSVLIYVMLHRYPRHMGLNENNVVFRAHNDALIARVDDDWWWIIKNFSRRDQLSLNYLLWKHGVVGELLMQSPTHTARNNSDLRCIPHCNDRRLTAWQYYRGRVVSRLYYFFFR